MTHRISPQNLLEILLFSCLAGVLTACGGGGGSPPPAPVPFTERIGNAVQALPQTPAVPGWPAGAPDTAAGLAALGEYQAHPALAAIGAPAAHAAGHRGAGTRVALIDENLDSNHIDLRRLDLPVVNERDTSVQSDSHGTTVARIAVGRLTRTDTAVVTDDIVGVAPQAALFAVGISLVRAPSVYIPATLPNIAAHSRRLASIVSEINRSNINVVNASIGVSGAITLYSANNYKDFMAYAKPLLDALAQEGSSSKIPYVIAAGNAYCLIDMPECTIEADDPELLAGLAVVDARLRGHVIAVVATQPSDPDDSSSQQVIADYSNRCGVAQDYCIAAPGTLSEVGEGTSFAAPRVSGALAVLLSASRSRTGSPQLSTEELVQRLYATANKTGIYADRAMYGQGFLDLAAAVAPVGQMGMAVGENLDEARPVFAWSRLAVGGASGDALLRAFAGRRLMLFDALAFPFPASLDEALDKEALSRERDRSMWRSLEWLARTEEGGFAQRDRDAPGFSALLPGPGGAGAWFALAEDNKGRGLFPDGGAGLGGHLGLLDAPAGVGYARTVAGMELRAAWFTALRGGEKNASGVVTQLRPGTYESAGDGPRLTLGLLRQGRALLDTTGTRGFALRGSTTWFAGLGGRHRLSERWWFFYGASLGYTRPRAATGSALPGGTPLFSSEGELGLGARDLIRAGDHLGLRLRQPLRVERGSVKVRYALSRTPERRVLWESFDASLSPSGRQLDLEGVYRAPLAEWLEAAVMLRWSRQPGHVRTARGEFGALGALRMEW